MRDKMNSLKLLSVLLLVVVTFTFLDRTMYLHKAKEQEKNPFDTRNTDTTNKWRSNNNTQKPQFTKRAWKTVLKEMAKDIQRPVEYACPGKIRRGHPLKIECNTHPFVINRKCLVYSFGINYEWRFDDAMAGLNCEVHAFDPSMVGTPEHIRPSGVHFHPLGLGGSSSTALHPRMDLYTKKHRNHTWTMKTLSEIMDSLGHTKIL